MRIYAVHQRYFRPYFKCCFRVIDARKTIARMEGAIAVPPVLLALSDGCIFLSFCAYLGKWQQERVASVCVPFGKGLSYCIISKFDFSRFLVAKLSI